MDMFNKESSGTQTKRFLEFKLGEESYAVGLLEVKEVITHPEVTPIPKSPAYVCGLINLRGIVLTVIDLRKKLGIQPSEDKSQEAVIIFDLNDRYVGVVVDSIHKVLNIGEECVKPVPDSDGKSLAHLLGILQHEERLTMWIDPVALLEGNVTALKAAA